MPESTLSKLAQDAARSKKLKAELEALYESRRTLDERVMTLEYEKQAEESDVEKLEEGSLAAFFYKVIGKADEKLTKEREEAYAAAVRYDAAVAELSAVESDIKKYETERRTLAGSEIRYKAALDERAAKIRESGGISGEKLLALEQGIAEAEAKLRELNEARQAGTAALASADAVTETLDKAEKYGVWDLFGGGLIADMAKHGSLDEAQTQIHNLQSELGRFKNELADVELSADITVSFSTYDRFCDIFFDGIFTNVAAIDRIANSRGEVVGVARGIERVIKHIDACRRDTEAVLENMRNRRESLIAEL